MAVAQLEMELLGRRKNMHGCLSRSFLILSDCDLPIQGVRFVIGRSGRLNAPSRSACSTRHLAFVKLRFPHSRMWPCEGLSYGNDVIADAIRMRIYGEFDGMKPFRGAELCTENPGCVLLTGDAELLTQPTQMVDVVRRTRRTRSPDELVQFPVLSVINRQVRAPLMSWITVIDRLGLSSPMEGHCHWEADRLPLTAGQRWDLTCVAGGAYVFSDCNDSVTIG
jgi:hypothetical protein